MNMKTLLNLLPEEKKAAIQSSLRFRFFLWQLFLVFCLECFYVGVLFGIYFILDFQLKNYQSTVVEVSSPSFSQDKQLSEYEEKFRSTNEIADVIGKIEYTHLYFTEVFLLLGELLPEGITVDRLSTKEYTVLLTGKAAKRDDLLLLGDRLKTSECIGNVNVPISNLFSEEDIEFQLDFSVKIECLRKN